ncbi:isochorismate synthase [Corynebacterium pseudodiphtheriticum]|uniref:isochorismate synthase n=1 Tax=Corynebacterium pseudodiphtheriticum TaxID=37637 RepID=A0ABT7FVH3_9CORY|nr:isochorismate synthase [Corynebacterium pseudodiphtheriticum]MDK4289773.1 isochorismate synthase [Corynebacterium pseudodiphtheriticum]
MNNATTPKAASSLPQFVFNHATASVTATGIARRFSSVDAALEFAHRGEHALVGAMPYHPGEPAALFIPSRLEHSDTPFLGVQHQDRTQQRQVHPFAQFQQCHQLQKTSYLPSLTEHTARVAQMRQRIRAGELDKIVLSRREVYQFASAIDPWQVFGELTRNSTDCYSHFVDLGAGRYFLGNSPEVLIRKTGSVISSFPLAGSVRRQADPAADQHVAQQLAQSSKDQHEHAFVTEGIREVLAPLCTSLTVPDEPTLMQTSHTWHLGTRILGELRDPHLSVVDLARMLHPTAAVNGAPASVAQSILAADEPDRGLYAGTVGWANENGDGEWRVAIRSALLDGDTVTAYAGGGIVADSDPDTELEETTFKLGPVRAALGISGERTHGA